MQLLKSMGTPELTIDYKRNPSPIERWGARFLLKAAKNPPVTLILSNGEAIGGVGVAPMVRLRLRRRDAVFRLLLDPVVCFGDLYSREELEVEGDLARFLEHMYRLGVDRGFGLLSTLRAIFQRLRVDNEVLTRHYDLGNDFYRLWLDRAMQYSCAYYSTPGSDLDQAQTAKMDHICRKLRLAPGERVIEAGCGWGGLAIHMARRYGVRVIAYNISSQQLRFAQIQAARLGLSDQVAFVQDDYRNIRGECDAFVSVGMLEHVGKERYSTLGGVIDRCLTGRGRGLIHSIGRVKPAATNIWINKRIFQGAHAPSLQELMAILEPWSFAALDIENLRPHYVKTLEAWLQRFEAIQDRIVADHGQQFFRAWHLYLCGSLAAFRVGDLQLYQVLFSRPQCDRFPLTRGSLYADFQT
ncbi:MAG: class I SAM-dependent methyltransferase [Gammaproteobacteria bacterium]